MRSRDDTARETAKPRRNARRSRDGAELPFAAAAPRLRRRTALRAHSIATYRHRALLGIPQLVGLLLAASLALGWSVWAGVVELVLAELVIVLLVPYVPAFQRHVDAEISWLEHQAAARQRCAVLARMSEVHRAELARLEGLADRIRESSAPGEQDRGVPSAAGEEDWLELNRVLAGYAELAIAHARSAAAFRTEEGAMLNSRVSQLWHARAQADDHEREWIDRQLGIAQRRAEVWTEARRGQELLARQLATAAEFVHFLFEQCTTAATAAAGADLRVALQAWQDQGWLARELSELRSGEPQVEPRALALGRLSRPPEGASEGATSGKGPLAIEASRSGPRT